MKDRIFIDTNVFVYAYMEDSSNLVKRQKIATLLKDISGDIAISTQVINEFYNVLLRNEISDKDIQKRIEEILGFSHLIVIDLEIIKYSWNVRKKYQYSIWDSLIISSVLKNNCLFLYSEDMQHNQIIENTLRIINPFIDN